MDELFDVLTLVQTNKITKLPIILVGKTYWSGLRDWIKQTMLEDAHNINEVDLDLMPIVEDPEEVIDIIRKFYDRKEKLGPNYEL